jgi:hypothetical protein
LAAAACGGDDDGSGGGAGDGGSGAAGGSKNQGGANVGGANAGGSNVGGMAATCGVTLLSRGSNYGSDPHDLVIPVADIEAGVTKTYSTTGTSHTHDITVTAADFEALRNGQAVKLYSCFSMANFTDHEFVLDCANPENTSTLDGEIGDETMCG